VTTPSNPILGVAFKTDAPTFAKALLSKAGWGHGSVTPYAGHLMFSRVLPGLPGWAFKWSMGPMMRKMAKEWEGGLERVDFFKWEGGKKKI